MSLVPWCPGALVSGTTYRVEIDTTQSVLASMVASPSTVSALAPDGTATDSDSNGVVLSPTVVGADVVAGAPGTNDHTVDFGFGALYALGNRLFLDNGPGAQRNNGIADSGELPVVGAVVELLTAGGASIDPDGVGPLTQTLVATDASGYYRFDALFAGDYRVLVASSNFT